MRGYKCEHKTAAEILETLGFDPRDAIRGWTLKRTGGRNNANAPERMHAIVHTVDDTEYIDIHADFQGPGNTHVSVRGRRTERWYEIFRQIDFDEPCDAGNKLLKHYGDLAPALEKYHGENS